MTPVQLPEVPDLSVVAVVSVNKDEALVMNRPIRFAYEKVGNDFIGRDGPFVDVLRFERAGRMKAFAGRKLSLRMANGSIHEVQDHWWQSMAEGVRSVVLGDVESLKKCYVFSGGACIAPADLAELRGTYAGCVYPYWDYEKIIKYDDQRRDLWKRIRHEERRRNSLIKEVRRLAGITPTGAQQ